MQRPHFVRAQLAKSVSSHTKERKFNAARPRPSALLTTASQARRAPGLAAYVDTHGQPPDQDDFERVVALKNAKVRCLLRPSRSGIFAASGTRLDV